MTAREQFLVDLAYVVVVYGVVPATIVRLVLRRLGIGRRP